VVTGRTATRPAYSLIVNKNKNKLATVSTAHARVNCENTRQSADAKGYRRVDCAGRPGVGAGGWRLRSKIKDQRSNYCKALGPAQFSGPL
jgi:hypothetical protein